MALKTCLHWLIASSFLAATSAAQPRGDRPQVLGSVSGQVVDVRPDTREIVVRQLVPGVGTLDRVFTINSNTRVGTGTGEGIQIREGSRVALQFEQQSGRNIVQQLDVRRGAAGSALTAAGAAQAESRPRPSDRSDAVRAGATETTQPGAPAGAEDRAAVLQESLRANLEVLRQEIDALGSLSQPGVQDPGELGRRLDLVQASLRSIATLAGELGTLGVGLQAGGRSLTGDARRAGGFGAGVSREGGLGQGAFPEDLRSTLDRLDRQIGELRGSRVGDPVRAIGSDPRGVQPVPRGGEPISRSGEPISRSGEPISRSGEPIPRSGARGARDIGSGIQGIQGDRRGVSGGSSTGAGAGSFGAFGGTGSSVTGGLNQMGRTQEDLGRTLDLMEEEIQELRATPGVSSAAQRAELARAADDLAARLRSARDLFDRMRSSRGPSWTDARDRLEQAILDLQTSFQQANTRFRNGLR